MSSQYHMPVLRTKPSSSDITLNLSQNTTANITLTFPALHMNNNVTIYNLDGSVNSEFTVTFPIEITMEDVTFSKIMLNDSQFNYEVFYTLQLNNYQTNTEYQTAISQSYMNVTTIPYTAPPVFAFGSITYSNQAYPNQEYLIPITISNNQDVATGTNFQLLLQFTPSSLSSYINPNCQNIAFYDSNNNKLYSWIENATSSTTSGSVSIWINLGSNNINPSSNITIYMAIGNSTSVNYLGNPSNVGAQPNYTSTYGEYDDGANVFTDYWNFAGTTLPTGLSYVNSTATITINNGATVTSPGTTPEYAWIYTTSAVASGQIIETETFTSTSKVNTRLGWSTTTSLGSQDTPYNSYDNNLDDSTMNGVGITSSSAFGVTATPSINITQQGIFSFAWLGTGSQWYAYDYQTATSSDTTNTIATDLYGFFGVGSYGYLSTGTTDSQSIYWLRVRTYPPNGVMPSVTFGNIQTVTQSTITIYPTNTGLLYFKGEVYNTTSSAVTFKINNPDGSNAYSLEVPANSPPETFEFYSPNWEINFQYVFTFTDNVTFNYFLCRETY